MRQIINLIWEEWYRLFLHILFTSDIPGDNIGTVAGAIEIRSLPGDKRKKVCEMKGDKNYVNAQYF